MPFTKLSFQKKLYLCCVALNLVLLFICSAVFYQYTTSSLKDNLETSLINNTATLSKDLDDIITDADNILKELQVNPTLISETREIRDDTRNYFAAHVPVSSAFLRNFRSILVSKDLNGSISFVSNYYDNIGVSPSGAYPYINKDKLKTNANLATFLEEDFYVKYDAPHKSYWGSDDTVFSVVRSMKSVYKKYGVLILDFNISAIEKLLQDFENPEAYTISLIDDNQKLIYSSSDQVDQKELLQHYPKNQTSEMDGTFSYNRTILSSYHVSPVTNWSFILSFSTEGYLHSMQNLFLISFLLFLSLSIIMSAFLYLVTQKLTSPLKSLTSKLTHLEPGENINLELASDDNEITMLTNAVQTFLSEIYLQNQQLTDARQRTMKAHYETMEAQLNPHFLYNTLSVIGMTGLSEGNTTVSTMCSELAGLLRYSLSYTGQAVKLEQEISNIKSYLYLMQMRYEDALSYQWELDSDVNSIFVPKLILQPLVENCFRHGFCRSDCDVPSPWQIRIRSFCDESYWYLSISNNGAPFDEQKLARLQNQISQYHLHSYNEKSFDEVKHQGGFGLENTVLRLYIYYSGKEFFQVDHKVEGWTTITIGGPREYISNFR